MQNQPSIASKFSRTAALLAGFVGVLGTLILLSYGIGALEVIKILPGALPLKASTAFCFLGFGMAQLIFWSQAKYRRSLSWAFIAIPFFIGNLNLLEHLYDTDLGGQWLFSWLPRLENGQRIDTQFTVPTAISMVLLSCSFLTSFTRSTRWIRFGDGLALIVQLLLLPVLIGYLYGIRALYSEIAFTKISFSGTAGMYLMSLSIMMGRAEVGLLRRFLGGGTGGALLRRGVPSIILILLTMGWFRLRGEELGYYDSKFGLALMVILNITVFLSLIWRAARRLDFATEALLREQAALRASERTSRNLAVQLQTVVNSAPISLTVFDPNGIITFSDGKVQAELGLKPGELIGQSIFECRIDNDLVIGQVRRALAGETLSSEIQVRDSWFLSNSTPVFDQSGQVTAVIGLAVDITERKKSEEVIRQREMQFRQLADSLPQIVWTADQDGKQDYFNDRWMSFTGKSQIESSAATWNSVVHPEDLAEFVRRWRNSVQSGESYEFEYRLKRASDASYRWHIRRAVALRDSHGRVMKWFGTCTDIHDQKTAYVAIVESKKMIETVIANTNAILFAFDREGIVTFSDGRGLGSLGLFPGERVGRSIFDIHKERPELLGHAIAALSGTKSRFTMELAGLWHEFYFDPVFDHAGRTTGVSGVAINVHDKVKSEQILLDTQERLRAVLKHVPFAFWAVGLDRRFLFREGIGIQAVGLQAGEMLGRTIDDVYRDHPAVIEIMNRALSGETFEVQAQVGKRWYQVAFAPSRDSNDVLTGITGITFDVTDRKQIEDDRNAFEIRERSAHEASHLKSEFLANMSHEIRTPINGVMGMAGLLFDTELTGDQAEFVGNIRRSADSLLTIINDILDFSKVEAGRLDLDDIAFDLESVVQDTVTSFAFSAKKKDLPLILEMPSLSETAFQGDPGRVRQVLANLLGNAVKFTQKGQVCLKVSQLAADAEKVSFRFEVIDTGIGISTDSVGRLFQAFQQADASMSRRFGGTGLGLSISKRLVELMDGTIGVSSDLEQGSKFWFELSFRRAATSLAEIRNVTPRAPTLSVQGARVLVAEDNPVNQLIAMKLLEKLGCRANAAANGREAIDALRTVPYDLILMDCQMPELDGYAASRQIREEKSSPFHQIPIVAMTANALKGDRERCIEAGMNDYVSKPCRFEDFAAVLEKWLPMKSSASRQA